MQPDLWSCAYCYTLVFLICSSQILRITFPFFDIENSGSCSFDFLEVHDGDSASSYLIGKYCGTAAPAELFSSHNSLYFWFRSDHSVSGRGFTVAWQSQAPGKPGTALLVQMNGIWWSSIIDNCSGPSHCDASKSYNIFIHFGLSVCGGELTNSYGDIKSPGYPGNYPPNRDCYWTVNVNPGLLITFAFGTLSLEHHDNCNFDYLEVRKAIENCIHIKSINVK